MIRIRLLLLVVAVLGLFDCLEATQITVVVTTNASCGDLRTTTLTVGQLGALEKNVPVSSRDGCETPPALIGSVVIVPAGKNDAPVAFRVVTGVKKNAEDCAPPDYKGCIVARRALSYAPHHPLRVNVRMDLSCLDVPCGELETCSNGACIPAEIPDPSKCNDPSGCDLTQGDAGMDANMDDAGIDTGTDSGIDTGIDTGVDAGPTEAPLACFTVADTSGVANVTAFSFDASCSTDPFDPPNALEVRWDFESDGTWDTQFTTTKTTTFTYPSPATPTATVQVRNTGGVTAIASHLLWVYAAQSDVLVTTNLDENDANATPSMPGGTGLSLREAIKYVDGLAMARIIHFKSAMTITTTALLPTLTATGASIIGRPGVIIDANGVGTNNAACVDLAAVSTKLAWVTITNCPGYSVIMDANNTQVTECTLLAGNQKGHGVEMNAMDELLGPRNDISGFIGSMNLNAYAVYLFSNPKPGKHVVDGNLIHGSWTGIQDGGWSGLVMQRNTIYANQNYGINMFALDNTTLIRFNVIDGNAADGIHVANNITAADIRNNILSNNGGYGISGTMGVMYFEPNGFFNNTAGNVMGAMLGMTSTTTDPLFMNRMGNDFRLHRASPCIDKGVDVGLDVNGPLPGNYNGTAPDFGANEF
jgi:hypothetical protein